MRWLPIGLAGLVLCMGHNAAAADTKLLFFDPDASQDRLITIVELFNEYVHASGSSVAFEPVSDVDAFNERLKDAGARFAIVTSSYLEHNRNGDLQPLLVPENDGSVYYQKFLVRLGQEGTNLRGKAIAATVGDAQAEHTLAILRDAGADVDGAVIVSVSKDVDALLALSFGQTDAAWVTEGSIKVLTQINPTTASQLKVAVKTANQLRAPLCEFGKRVSPKQRTDMLRLIDDLGNVEQGRQLLQVLNMQRWIKFKPEMLK